MCKPVATIQNGIAAPAEKPRSELVEVFLVRTSDTRASGPVMNARFAGFTSVDVSLSRLTGFCEGSARPSVMRGGSGSACSPSDVPNTHTAASAATETEATDSGPRRAPAKPSFP